MANKPIALVTGGAGFIGSHMVDLLLQHDYQVRVIDNLIGGHSKNLKQHAHNPNLYFAEDDILNLSPNSSLFHNVSYVFHFAGIGDIVPSIENPSKYMLNNVYGTVKVLEAARYAKIKKFVYAASSSCYGLATTPTDEKHNIAPQYPYALSKHQGECAAFHWHHVYKMPVNSIRIFNAYGTRVRTTGAYGAVFGVFFKQKLADKPYTVVGDGNQTRDFLYVTDVAKAFLAAAETSFQGEAWNIGANKPQSINYLIELLGGGNITYVPKRPGEPDCTWADITKIKNQLRWSPQVSFEEGVKMMLAEINNWQDAPLWDKDSIANATQTWFEYLD
ncbi:MAG: NAD-dependent dehydratase [Gammaproteobacteria bacterium RIFCSPHIGHO2_12_FULL_35_23]|nr:MAG: NAD-dependent dehydratase [Gammaproteobacteria bacterium RIFCSPHIGHO2_12_FULL_35_23]